MPLPPHKHQSPARPISASNLNRLGQESEALHGFVVGANYLASSDIAGITAFYDREPRRIVIEINGPGLGPKGDLYSWKEEKQNDFISPWTDDAEGGTGSYAVGLPARELSGKTDVPLNHITEAWWAPGLDFVYFTYVYQLGETFEATNILVLVDLTVNNNLFVYEDAFFYQDVYIYGVLHLPGSTQFPSGTPQKVVTEVCPHKETEEFSGPGHSNVNTTQTIVDSIAITLEKTTKVKVWTTVHYTGGGAGVADDEFKVQLYDVDTGTANAYEGTIGVTSANIKDSRTFFWLLDLDGPDTHNYQLKLYRNAGTGTISAEADSKVLVNAEQVTTVESRVMNFLPGTTGNVPVCEDDPNDCCPPECEQIDTTCCPDRTIQSVLAFKAYMQNDNPASSDQGNPTRIVNGDGTFGDPFFPDEGWVAATYRVGKPPNFPENPAFNWDALSGWWAHYIWPCGTQVWTLLLCDTGAWVVHDVTLWGAGSTFGALDNPYFGEQHFGQNFFLGSCDSPQWFAGFDWYNYGGGGLNVPGCQNWSANFGSAGTDTMWYQWAIPDDGSDIGCPPSNTTTKNSCCPQTPATISGTVDLFIGGVAVMVGTAISFTYADNTPAGYAAFDTISAGQGMGAGFYGQVVLPCGITLDAQIWCAGQTPSSWLMTVGLPKGLVANTQATQLALQGSAGCSPFGPLNFDGPNAAPGLVAGPCWSIGDGTFRLIFHNLQ